MLSCINLVYQLSEMQTHEIKYWMIVASTLVMISLYKFRLTWSKFGILWLFVTFWIIVMDNYKTLGLNIAAKFLNTIYNFYEYTDIIIFLVGSSITS